MVRKSFLKTPLVGGGSFNKFYRHWERCCAEAIPYAIFRKASVYGCYSCDLSPMLQKGLRLTDEGCQQLKQALEAIFDQWFSDKNLFKRERYVTYSWGPVSIKVEPCPIGQEQKVHKVVCKVLSQNIESCEPIPDWKRLRAIENETAIVRKGGRERR